MEKYSFVQRLGQGTAYGCPRARFESVFICGDPVKPFQGHVKQIQDDDDVFVGWSGSQAHSQATLDKTYRVVPQFVSEHWPSQQPTESATTSQQLKTTESATTNARVSNQESATKAAESATNRVSNQEHPSQQPRTTESATKTDRVRN